MVSVQGRRYNLAIVKFGLYFVFALLLFSWIFISDIGLKESLLAVLVFYCVSYFFLHKEWNRHQLKKDFKKDLCSVFALITIVLVIVSFLSFIGNVLLSLKPVPDFQTHKFELSINPRESVSIQHWAFEYDVVQQEGMLTFGVDFFNGSVPEELVLTLPEKLNLTSAKGENGFWLEAGKNYSNTYWYTVNKSLDRGRVNFTFKGEIYPNARFEVTAFARKVFGHAPFTLHLGPYECRTPCYADMMNAEVNIRNTTAIVDYPTDYYDIEGNSIKPLVQKFTLNMKNTEDEKSKELLTSLFLGLYVTMLATFIEILRRYFVIAVEWKK